MAKEVPMEKKARSAQEELSTLLEAAPAPKPKPVPRPPALPPMDESHVAHHLRSLPAVVTDDDGTTRVLLPPGHGHAGGSGHPGHDHEAGGGAEHHKPKREKKGSHHKRKK